MQTRAMLQMSLSQVLNLQSGSVRNSCEQGRMYAWTNPGHDSGWGILRGGKTIHNISYVKYFH
jgi:hypothetical protein